MTEPVDMVNHPMTIHATANFTIQRRDANEFNMAQIWHECELTLSRNMISWSDVKSLEVYTTDVEYKVRITFTALADTSNWRGVVSINK